VEVARTSTGVQPIDYSHNLETPRPDAGGMYVEVARTSTGVQPVDYSHNLETPRLNAKEAHFNQGDMIAI
jgi:hypothetical protein